MSAGLGFKDFSTGEVLTAADVDGYLMQGIWVFASAAARDAAVTSPQEGNACYLKDTDVIQVYTGSAWAAQSASNPISANIVDAKGDLIVGTAADTVSRLAVGANGTTLVADSAEATGLKWATASSASGPAFGVYGSAAQNSIANNTFVKAALNTELWDTDNCYDTTNYRFTPNKAGYYQINTQIKRTISPVGDAIISIFKNGTRYSDCANSDNVVNLQVNSGLLIYLNGTTDYIEWYVYLSSGGTRNIQNDSFNITTGVWIRS